MLIGLFNFQKLTLTFKFIVALLVLTFTSEMVAHLFALLYNNNYPVFHVFNPLQYTLISMAFYHVPNAGRFLKSFAVISAISLILFAIYKVLFDNALHTFPSYILQLESIFILVLVILTFQIIINDDSIEPIYSRSLFWLNLGLMFFFSTSFLIWSFHKTFINHFELDRLAFKFLLIQNYFLYLCIIVSIIFDFKAKKNK
jgi:hypothetical protein